MQPTGSDPPAANPPAANPPADHRRMKRHRAKKSLGVTCRKGMLGLGANLGVRMNDISVDGIQLFLKSALAPGDDIEVIISIPGISTNLSREAKVVWCSGPEKDGFRVGAKFRHPLEYHQIFHMT